MYKIAPVAKGVESQESKACFYFHIFLPPTHLGPPAQSVQCVDQIRHTPSPTNRPPSFFASLFVLEGSEYLEGSGECVEVAGDSYCTRAGGAVANLTQSGGRGSSNAYVCKFGVVPYQCWLKFYRCPVPVP